MTNIHNHKILILDFGSQYTQLIARRVREIGVYCELWAWDVTEEQIREFNPTGIILSGGPESTTEANSPRAPEYVFHAGVPVLGICYGMQTMAMQLGGLTETSDHREFGYASVALENATALFANLNNNLTACEPKLDVWMSHGDKVTRLPENFKVTGTTPTCPVAAMSDENRRFYGVQFHPEVTHTKKGLEVAKQIRKNDPYASIVFFTTHSEYLPLTFQYQLVALDFIDKSLEGEDFQKRVESIILLTCKKIQSQNPEDAFRIENVKTVIQVPFHDILYLETSDIVHKVILYTKEEQIEFYGSLSQIEKSDPRLFKCHKSFLINPENVIKLDKSTGTVYFENGGVCYVSKLKLKKLLERIRL